jgi:hypothetical protein
MMANCEKQMDHQGWEAGYAEGYAAGLEEAWTRVSALIAPGPLPPGQSERRNAPNAAGRAQIGVGAYRRVLGAATHSLLTSP